MLSRLQLLSNSRERERECYVQRASGKPLDTVDDMMKEFVQPGQDGVKIRTADTIN